jgi:hypothetical protein
VSIGRSAAIARTYSWPPKGVFSLCIKFYFHDWRLIWVHRTTNGENIEKESTYSGKRGKGPRPSRFLCRRREPKGMSSSTGDEELTEFFTGLVSTETENPPGNERPCTEFGHGWFEARRIDSTLVGDRPDPRRRPGGRPDRAVSDPCGDGHEKRRQRRRNRGDLLRSGRLDIGAYGGRTRRPRGGRHGAQHPQTDGATTVTRSPLRDRPPWVGEVGQNGAPGPVVVTLTG